MNVYIGFYHIIKCNIVNTKQAISPQNGRSIPYWSTMASTLPPETTTRGKCNTLTPYREKMASNRPISITSIYRENEDLYQYLMFTFMMWNDVSSLETLLKYLELDTIPRISVDQLIRTDEAFINGVLANGMDKCRFRQCVNDFISKTDTEIGENKLHLLELAVISQLHWNKGDVIQFLMQSHYYGTPDEHCLTLIRCLDWCFKSRSYYTISNFVLVHAAGRFKNVTNSKFSQEPRLLQ